MPRRSASSEHRSARALLALASVGFVGCAAAPLQGAPPNILLVLADDLEADFKQDRLALMPRLAALRAAGVSFANHIAADPVCGPSRASLLAGRYPHNVGYRANDDARSVAAWRAAQNNTLGTWLTRAGYETTYLGKYVNGLETEVPSGWRSYQGFDGIAGTYNFYNARQYNATFAADGETLAAPVTSTLRTGVHQADFLGAQAVAAMRAAAAAARPFFIHLAPVMIHYGTCDGPFLDPLRYARDDPFWEAALGLGFGCNASGAEARCDFEMSPCVSARNARFADNLTNPITPAWGAAGAGARPPSMRLPPATPYERARQDVGFRNRTGSARDFDDMLGVALDGLAELGLEDSTFVVVVSDNGYHLNEHRLLMGKETPYETDVRVPLYVRGPGIAANSTSLLPSNHVDLAATIVELARAQPSGPPLDGLSFAAELTAPSADAAAWRDFSFAENADGERTWLLVRRPLAAAGGAAARTVFHRWCANVSEVFDLDADPWQVTNLAEGATPRGDAVASAALPFALALAACAGRNCSFPAPPAAPAGSLACYVTNRTI